MLLNFSVSNYKSFKERKELNLVATADKEHLGDNTFLANNQRLLKSVAIYGPNASGKTNLLKAIRFIREFVLQSANNQAGETIPITIFKLDSKMKSKPSVFETNFVVEGIRYKYGFEVNETRVLKEWLHAYKTKQPQCWFERTFTPEKKEYSWKFGNKFKGKVQSWKELTLENTLFLSRAIQLNSEQLKPIYQWFKDLFVLNSSEQLFPGRTADWILDSDENKKEVLNFLKISGDNSGITNIDIRNEEIPKEKLAEMFGEKMAKRFLKNSYQKPRATTINLSHKITGSKKTVDFDFMEESAGTRKLISLASSWLNTIKEGRILIIDELNNSLHPILAKFLIQIFHDKEINKNGGQLIFTGHDSFLLDLEVFRRDQIWFTEKNAQDETDLYSLAEYSPRKNESIEKGYLKGRYDALPHIDETILS